VKEQKFRIFLIPLIAALAVYFVGFYGVEHLRHRKGPWSVDFVSTNQTPVIVVNQPVLGISGVTIILAEESVASSFTNSTVTFVDPREVPFAVPHGRVVYLDMTFLPGTVTFDLHGHAIELIPRALLINGREYPWENNSTILLQPDDKKNPITPAEFMERIKAAKEKESLEK